MKSTTCKADTRGVRVFRRNRAFFYKQCVFCHSKNLSNTEDLGRLCMDCNAKMRGLLKSPLNKDSEKRK